MDAAGMADMDAARHLCPIVLRRYSAVWPACLGSPGAGGARPPCPAYGGHQHETGWHSAEGTGARKCFADGRGDEKAATPRATRCASA